MTSVDLKIFLYFTEPLFLQLHFFRFCHDASSSLHCLLISLLVIMIYHVLICVVFASFSNSIWSLIHRQSSLMSKYFGLRKRRNKSFFCRKSFRVRPLISSIYNTHFCYLLMMVPIVSRMVFPYSHFSSSTELLRCNALLHRRIPFQFTVVLSQL